MHCSACSAEIADGSKFCTECGTKLGAGATPRARELLRSGFGIATSVLLAASLTVLCSSAPAPSVAAATPNPRPASGLVRTAVEAPSAEQGAQSGSSSAANVTWSETVAAWTPFQVLGRGRTVVVLWWVPACGARAFHASAREAPSTVELLLGFEAASSPGGCQGSVAHLAQVELDHSLDGRQLTGAGETTGRCTSCARYAPRLEGFSFVDARRALALFGADVYVARFADHGPRVIGQLPAPGLPLTPGERVGLILWSR